MTMPGFSAEASLGTTSTYYRTSGSPDQPEGVIHPAQLGRGRRWPPIDQLCYGQCVSDCLFAETVGGARNLLPYCYVRCARACGPPWF
jgi:hypothetical protein